jgi:Zn-dependent peptidase ImmA (M78 family)
MQTENDSTNLGPRKTSAKNLAKKLIKDAKINEAPVSLQKVIEYLQLSYNLSVRRANFGTEVSGLLVKCKTVDDEFHTIGFNENHPWCRRRFTIAHEIGHLLFGHVCDKSGSNAVDNERESDIFAAELLMPTAILKEDFKKTPNIPELSKLYRVSAEAMAIKLGDARLLKW